MEKRFSLTVTLLTLLGIVPFIASALVASYEREVATYLLHRPSDAELVGLVGRTSLIAYAGSILSFVAGARWGGEFGKAGDRINAGVMALAVIPSIIAWVMLIFGMLPGTWVAGAMLVLSGCFLMLLAWDSTARYPAWYMTLRTIATLSALVCLIAVAMQILPG